MEPMTRRSHPLSRQEIKEILHDEFGFGEKRMQRFMGRLKEKHQKVLKGDGTGDGGKDL